VGGSHPALVFRPLPRYRAAEQTAQIQLIEIDFFAAQRFPSGFANRA
jgi:hypothetical protein